METTLYITEIEQGFELEDSQGNAYGFVSDTLSGAIEICKELIENGSAKYYVISE